MFFVRVLWFALVAFWMFLYHRVSLFSNHSKYNVCALGFLEQQHCLCTVRNALNKLLTTLTLWVIKQRERHRKGCIRKKAPSTTIYNLEHGWLMYVCPQMTNIYSFTCLGVRIHFSIRQPCFNKHSFNLTHSMSNTHICTILYTLHMHRAETHKRS